MVISFPWKCPRTDAKKVTCIVALPSGVVPESVEFTFQGRNSFESQCFNLTFDWPEKLLTPSVIFRVDMRKDQGFREKNEFVEFREAVRKIKNATHYDLPKSTITIKLHFMVQRSISSYTKELRRFGTSNSAILSSAKVKEEFTSLSQMAKHTTSCDHKVYFMVLRFTGVEVEEEDNLDKRTRCIEDCDESSLSSDNYQDHINRNEYHDSQSTSFYTPNRKKRRYGRMK